MYKQTILSDSWKSKMPLRVFLGELWKYMNELDNTFWEKFSPFPKTLTLSHRIRTFKDFVK